MRKALIMIMTVFVITALVIVLFASIPRCTKISQTLSATKVDEGGNVVDNTQIVMQGRVKDYLFYDDLLDISVAAFDDLSSIQVVQEGHRAGATMTQHFDKVLSVTFTAVNTVKDDTVFGTAFFSEDFEYWAFLTKEKGKNVAYVASASGTHTIQETIQFFRGLIPGYDPNTENAENG